MPPKKSVSPKPLKVGFDLDGVILYNPVRIVRPIITTFKRDVLKIKKTKFKIPTTPMEKTIFALLHKSSLFIDPGYRELVALVNQKKMTAYLITGRFSFLKHDTQTWLKKMNARHVFIKWFYNQNDEQPHIYKANLIKKLDLDYFIEDNWDIVEYLESLRQKKQLKTKVIWIYNLFDRHLNHPHKYPHLKKSLEFLKSGPLSQSP